MEDYERRSIEEYGFSDDYFNPTYTTIMYLPESSRFWEDFYAACEKGEIETYAKTYANEPEILEASDPLVVSQLDQLVERLIDAGKKRDYEGSREVMQELVDMRKF